MTQAGNCLSDYSKTGFNLIKIKTELEEFYSDNMLHTSEILTHDIEREFIYVYNAGKAIDN
jgi:hypothetical protein